MTRDEHDELAAGDRDRQAGESAESAAATADPGPVAPGLVGSAVPDASPNADGHGVELEPADGSPPESAALVEDAPGEAPAEDAQFEEAPAPAEQAAAAAHAGGELDVPDGYTVLEGAPVGRRRSVVVVVSRFNGGLTNRLLARALEALEEAEVAPEAITVVPVPGAFELPLAAMALAKTRKYSCVVALGAVVRGETPHFDFVASEAASGLQLAGIETGVPVAFGVLTVETVEQGEARIDRAADAVRSALEMADLFARLRASAA